MALTEDTDMTLYAVTDGYAAIAIEADSADEAAQKYVDGGDWPDEGKTTFIGLRAAVLPADCGLADDDPVDPEIEHSLDDWEDCSTIEIDPDEPDCTDEDGHDWDEDGPYGHGGGIIIRSTCSHCGLRKVYDTWGQDPQTGEQGLKTITYIQPEEAEQ